MKRRDFIAASALLSLFGGAGEALAKPAKKAAAPAKPAKSSRKPSRGGRGQIVEMPPERPRVGSADAPVTDNPPPGSSATRLPPVKAPEPPALWRTYEITTNVFLPSRPTRSRLWLPMPFSQDTLFQRHLATTWNSNAQKASMRRLPDGELEVFYCEWAENVPPQLQITCTVSTADRHFDITKRTMAPEREDILRRNLQSSRLIPNEGIAHELGAQIVGRIKDPVAQAKAIYDWVVDNTIYDPNLPACGTGNVRAQFEQRQFGGRSADINGLFVSLCRGIGIPARCVYGLRVGGSRLFKSLGLKDEDATVAQHCRAEFYVPGYSWVPVDPCDVRRAIAMEALSDRDPKVVSLRKILFGVWEMNWLAYNYSSDTPLPELAKAPPFFALPHSDQGGTLNAGTRPEDFKYNIITRQLLEG